MRLLIVDDEPAMRELLSRWLVAAGYDVLQAADADAAAALLEAHSIAVALCDRAMPGQGGDWLVTQLRSRFPTVAIILATADDSVPTRISLRDGVVGYLVKPFKNDLVLNAVADAIAWHQAAVSSAGRPGAPDDTIETWLRGRAGRPDVKREP